MGHPVALLLVRDPERLATALILLILLGVPTSQAMERVLPHNSVGSSTAGRISSATDPTTHGTPLRSRTTGSVTVPETIDDELITQTNGATGGPDVAALADPSGSSTQIGSASA